MPAVVDDMNSLLTINPYVHQGTWVFDDPAVGLVREPFASGIPEMIEVLTRHIPGAARGFRLTFAAGPFPGAQAAIEWVREDMGGNWYRWPEQNLEGWLCPALFKYFDDAPQKLYLRADTQTKDQMLQVPRTLVEHLLALLIAHDFEEAEDLVRAALAQ
jgi:hypothetical protein